MAVTTAGFLADFQEFSNAANYPPSLIAHWLSVAGLLLNAPPWDDTPGDDGRSLLDIGKELFAAHWIVLAKRNADSARAGAAPGQSQGMIASKAVGPASQSFNTEAVLEPGAGHWNLTVYGTQFIHFVRIFGAGPLQVGIGCDPFGSGFLNGPAWPGPWPWPSQTGFG